MDTEKTSMETVFKMANKMFCWDMINIKRTANLLNIPFFLSKQKNPGIEYLR